MLTPTNDKAKVSITKHSGSGHGEVINYMWWCVNLYQSRIDTSTKSLGLDHSGLCDWWTRRDIHCSTLAFTDNLLHVHPLTNFDPVVIINSKHLAYFFGITLHDYLRMGDYGHKWNTDPYLRDRDLIVDFRNWEWVEGTNECTWRVANVKIATPRFRCLYWIGLAYFWSCKPIPHPTTPKM